MAVVVLVGWDGGAAPQRFDGTVEGDPQRFGVAMIPGLEEHVRRRDHPANPGRVRGTQDHHRLVERTWSIVDAGKYMAMDID